MHRESSTVFGGLQLGNRTGTPATFFGLGAEVCHPNFGLRCGHDKLDGPFTGFESNIGDLPHAARTICDVNLCTGLLLRHGAYRKSFKVRQDTVERAVWIPEGCRT